MPVTSTPSVTGTFDTNNLPTIVVRAAGTIGTSLTAPMAQFLNTVNNFTQVAIQNKSAGASGSSDHICYPDNNTNDLSGFVDIGVCSSTFADAAYACTGPNDAYIFGSAVSGASKNGNLVVWTDSTGTLNEIVFGTGGFSSAANERFRIKLGGACRFMPLASAPAAVSIGDVYYNSTLNKLQVRTASAWETITSV